MTTFKSSQSSQWASKALITVPVIVKIISHIGLIFYSPLFH